MVSVLGEIDGLELVPEDFEFSENIGRIFQKGISSTLELICYG